MNTNRRDALKLMGISAAALALGGCGASSSSAEDTTVVDTVIVGGGFAGLTAALELQEANQSFVVLEANDRVGGRSWTVLKDDYWIDNGAQWGDKYQEELLGQSINRIHFAGTETTDKTYAYLDGAIRSGKRAAKEIIG